MVAPKNVFANKEAKLVTIEDGAKIVSQSQTGYFQNRSGYEKTWEYL